MPAKRKQDENRRKAKYGGVRLYLSPHLNLVVSVSVCGFRVRPTDWNWESVCRNRLPSGGPAGEAAPGSVPAGGGGGGGMGAGQGEGPGQVLQEGTESVTSAIIRCLVQPHGWFGPRSVLTC